MVMTRSWQGCSATASLTAWIVHAVFRTQRQFRSARIRVAKGLASDKVAARLCRSLRRQCFCDFRVVVRPLSRYYHCFREC